MLATKKSEVSELQVKWLESKQKRQRLSGEVAQPLLKRSWSWVGDAEHAGPDAKMSKRSIRDEENDRALGGMRNPWAAVKRLSKVAEVGRDIARLWRHFVQRWPEALDTARDYGSKACAVLPECVESWKKELMQLLRCKSSQVVLKEKIEFSQPPPGELVGSMAASVFRPREVHRGLGERRSAAGDELNHSLEWRRLPCGRRVCR